MKFIIERDILFKNLKYINSITSVNIVTNLNNILIKISKNNIIIICCNNEIKIYINTPFIYKSEYKNKYIISISYKKIYNICKSIDKKNNINFIIKNNFLLINNKNTNFYILIYKNYNNFISLKNNIKNFSFTINKNSFIYIINKTIFLSSNIDINDLSNYVLFEILNDKILLTFTDGYRLINNSFEIVNTNNYINLSISRKTLIELNKLLLYINDEIININIYDKYININTEKIKFYFIIYKYLFPNYINIINEKRKYIININKNIFIKSINKIISISDDKISILRIIINKENIMLKMINNQNEISKEIIETNINHNINNYEIGLNPIYLINILNKINSEYINIHFSNKNSSLRIEDIDDKNSINIIMPIKI